MLAERGTRDQTAVRSILERVKADNRNSLSAPEAKAVCDAYGIPVPQEALATSADAAAKSAESMGFPVVMKIVSPDILHKTEAGGVIVGVSSADAARRAYDQIVASAKKYKSDAKIVGVQVQQQLGAAQEVIVGAISDQSFGELIAFGLGGVLVEVLKDVTFRLAPASREDALSMLDGIQAAEILKGVRGGEPVSRDALASIIENVSALVTDFPEISEVDLNPVFARPDGATAVDARILVDWNPPARPKQHSRDEIVRAMKRIMRHDAGDGAVFAIPAKFVAGALVECGEKKIPGAVLIPSGFAETGNVAGQQEIQAIGQRYNVRLMGPNIYGFYYTPKHLCATFCTAYDYQGKVALSSQSGGVGMAIIGFSRSAKMGVSAIVWLGNKADIDEDDLLTFFEQDENTQAVAMHMEDLKDGRAFAEVAKRVSKTKPVMVLKAGRTALGAKAASSHTGALAGDDKVYDDVLRQSGVIRARGLRELLDFARGVPVLPTPKGENGGILTGAGGSGVLLSDSVVDAGLALMKFPADLDEAFKKFIPPFGASGNPVDITGGEPPKTYQNTIRLGLKDERIHALILGYWHTIITPPMVFAKLVVEVVEEMKAKGIRKPIVASLAGDVQVEEAAEHLYDHGIPAYAYSTEIPVAVLGAKFKWARGAGLVR